MTVFPSGPYSRRPDPARILVSLVLLAAAATAETPSLPVDADFYPLVRGSTWTYAAEPSGIDIVVDALNTEKTACRDPRACSHDHGHDQETEPTHDHDEKKHDHEGETEKDQPHDHDVKGHEAETDKDHSHDHDHAQDKKAPDAGAEKDHDADHAPHAGHDHSQNPDHNHPQPAGASDADTHTYHVFTFSVVPRNGGRQPVRLQREWLRRDEAGDLRCGRRTLNQEEIFLDPPQLVLPADPPTRKTWTWSGTLGFDAAKVTSTVEAEEETVRVPAGTFKALRVRVRTETFRGKGETTRWYAAGVGLVKEETRIEVKDGRPVRTSLALESYRIGPDAPGDRHQTKSEKPSPR
jgi:hypothetical protein